jgi:drug/metabolite transporter (DMT)-like permease
MVQRYALLLLGVFGCSTAVIQIKASSTHPALIAPFRLLLAAAILTPVFIMNFRRHRAHYDGSHLRRTVLPAAILAAHMITWTFGARMTFAAQSSLIVNLSPIAIPFFLHALVGERINRAEIVGTAIAITGVLLLTAHDALSGEGDLLGNVICFISMLLFAWYLALGRANRDFPSLWLYVVPVYLQAGVLCLILGAPWLHTFDVNSTREWLLMLGLAVVPTIIGHSLLNYSMRHFRGQIVSLCNVGQFLFATAMAYFLFAEHPSVLFYAASAVVVGGIALVVFSAPTAPPRLR